MQNSYAKGGNYSVVKNRHLPSVLRRKKNVKCGNNKYFNIFNILLMFKRLYMIKYEQCYKKNSIVSNRHLFAKIIEFIFKRYSYTSQKII